MNTYGMRNVTVHFMCIYYNDKSMTLTMKTLSSRFNFKQNHKTVLISASKLVSRTRNNFKFFRNRFQIIRKKTHKCIKGLPFNKYSKARI